MKLFLFTTLVFFSSSNAFAQCISLEQAQGIAYEEVKNKTSNDPQGYAQGNYYGWEEAVENLEYTTWKGVNMYLSSWSVSNWEKARMSVDCNGAFSVWYSQTED